MSDHLIAEANRHAKALPKMTLPTTKPNDPDLPWYIAECMDLKKHLAIECAAKHEYLRMINELKVKAGFYEREIARLRAENAALQRDVYQCPPTSENDYEGFKWRDACEELECENAALKKSILNAEVLAEYDPAHGHKDWWSGGCWLRSGQQIMIIDRAAIDPARKEAQL